MKSFYKNQNLNLIASTAQQIVFNNSKNGKLESTNTQDAIDEISNILDEEKTMISDAWNNSTTYTVGQYCIYNNTLWKCLVQHNGQEPSEGTYWTKTQIDDEMLAIKNDVSTINSNLIKVEFIDIIVTTVANQNAIGGYYAFIGSINPTKGKKIAVIPIGSVRTDKNGIGGVICKYHSSESGIDTFTLNASSAAEYRCDFICLYTE